MTKTFKVGDIVCHKAGFLKSIRWLTNVPLNGKVTNADDPAFPFVHWCDEDEPKRINANNLILYSERHLDWTSGN